MLRNPDGKEAQSQDLGRVTQEQRLSDTNLEGRVRVSQVGMWEGKQKDIIWGLMWYKKSEVISKASFHSINYICSKAITMYFSAPLHGYVSRLKQC